MFDGEYIRGIKWHGIVYDNIGNIINELNNGNGKIKEYSHQGNLLYEGEYLNGRKNGNGKNIVIMEN